MSRENVEIVRRVIEGARPDTGDAAIQGALVFWHPHCELRSLLAAVEPQTYRGHDGIRRYVSDMADAWSEWHNEIEHVFEPAPGTVVATFRSRLVGKDSGVTLEQQLSAVCVLSARKVLRFENYRTREEALEAVGLGE